MSSAAATYAEAAMRRRSVLRLLAVAVAVTLGATACSVGVGTPPEDYVAPDEQGGGNGDGGGAATDVDLLVDGPEVALADLADAVGTERVKALQLAIYTDSVYLEAQDPDDPSRVVVYNWNVGEGVTDGGETDVAGVDLEAQLFPLNQIDFSTIPGLVAGAPGLTGVQGDVTSSVNVQRPAGSPTLITVFVSTPRGQNGAVIADQAGNVLSTS